MELLHKVHTCNVFATNSWYMFHGIVSRQPRWTASDWHFGNTLCISEIPNILRQH